VDNTHALILAHAVTAHTVDNRQLRPTAEAARDALQAQTLDVLADAGYSNGEHAAQLEAQGLWPHIPAHRAINNQAAGSLFNRTAFTHSEVEDTFPPIEVHADAQTATAR
jgi:hypothetical protein